VRRREHATQERDTPDTKFGVGHDRRHPLVADLSRISHILLARRGEDAEIDVEEGRFVHAGHTYARVVILGR